ncbi:hypothetical protein L3Q82_015465, partial [Scortum barcoo]
ISSLSGYGACSYLRAISKTGQISCSLVIGKARVIPTKVMTIPRLKLSSAVTAVRNADVIKRELEIENLQEYYWTDSKVVLGYVKNDAKRFHTFTATGYNIAFPKALGFTDQSKRHFPHGFSSRERLNYVGPYPPSGDYGLERMSASDRDAFLAWYRDASRGVFDFKKEALKYCRQDVDILAEGCLRFRDQFVKDTQLDPFSCITIASACIKVFRTNFLTPQTLAVPPPDDYRRQFKSFSHPCIQWLELISHSRSIFIQHARNRGFERPERPEVEPLHETERPKEDEAMSKVLKGLPSRSRKNAEYILQKMKNTD